MGSGRNLNSSKPLWSSLLPARMKIHQKLKALEWSQQFLHHKVYGDFSEAQGQLTLQSEVSYGRVLKSSETLLLYLLPARMKKFKKNKGARVVTSLFIDFSDVQWQLTL